MMTTLTIFLVTIAVIVLVLWIVRRQVSDLPPGPTTWPLLGSIPVLVVEYYSSGRPSPLILLDNLARKYGNIYSLKLGPQLVVVANDLETIREAGQNQQMTARPKQIVNQTQGQGVALCSGDAWLQQRRFTLSALRSFGVGKNSFEEQISDETNHLMSEFQKYDSKPFDPKFLLLNATSNVLCSVIFGKRYEYANSDFQLLLKIMDVLVRRTGTGGSSIFSPLARILPKSKEQKETDEMGSKLKEFLTKIIEEHKHTFNANNLSDYIDVYLNEMKLSRAVTSHLNDSNLLATLVQMFFAGTDTSATAIRWALLYMIEYPDIKEKAHKELDDVVGRNRLPKLSDRQYLPYTDAVIHEVMRIGTISPLAIPHYSTSDTKIQGYNVPEGAMILLNLWAWHNDPNMWVDPASFRPERFINREGKLHKTENVIPFAFGRRQCIGEQLARKEMFIFYAHLMHRFTFKKAKEGDKLNLTGSFGITNSPYSYEICATVRE